MNDRLSLMIYMIMASLVFWVFVLLAATKQNPKIVWWNPCTWAKELWVLLLLSPLVNALIAYTAKL